MRFLVVFAQPAVDQGRNHLLGQFALVHADHVAARVDEVERRPGARAKGLPVGEVGVVEDGVLNSQPEDGLAQVLGLALGGELGRVDGDDLDGVGVAALDLPQLRKHVEAVDSSVGPEVEDEEPSAEVAHRHLAARVEPGHAGWGTSGAGVLPKAREVVMRISFRVASD